MDMRQTEDPLSVLDEIGDHNEQGMSLLAMEALLIAFCLAAYAFL